MVESVKFLIIISIAMKAACCAASGDGKDPGLTATPKRHEDRVTIQSHQGKTVLSVRSPSGIGGATIERAGETWLHPITMRLRLRGLEHFRATSGDLAIEAEVSSSDRTQRVRLLQKGKEVSAPKSGSPYWLAILPVGGDGKPARSIPIDDGYFEVTLPKALFERNPKSITLEWIDFYR